MKKLLGMLLLLNIISITSFGQLRLKGAIVDKQTKKPLNVNIMIVCSDSVNGMGTFINFTSSSFRRTLDLNYQYKLIASCNGYKDKIIIIDAKCPNEKRFEFEFDILMVKETPDNKDNDIYAGNIFFNKKIKDFDSKYGK